MRWEALFADLSGAFDAGQAAELAAEVEDRTRREQARLHLVDRLVPALGASIVVTVPHLGALRGVLSDVGVDWLLLTEAAGRQALLPLAAITTVTGLGPHAVEPDMQSVVTARLRLGYALRAIARDRATVSLTLADATTRHGTIDRVAADHLELAEHPADAVRRPADVHAMSIVAFTALVAVRSH